MTMNRNKAASNGCNLPARANRKHNEADTDSRTTSRNVSQNVSRNVSRNDDGLKEADRRTHRNARGAQSKKGVACLLALLVTGALCLSAHAQTCYEVDPGAPGWHAVDAPDGLTFGYGVEHFRVGKPAIRWQNWPVGRRILYDRTRAGWYTNATLYLEDTRSTQAQIKFPARLSGIKVEAFGVDTHGGRHTLFEEARIQGNEVFLDWSHVLAPVERLEVIFHVHFRETPVIEEVLLGESTAALETTLPEDLSRDALLLFRSPDGAPLKLCRSVSGAFHVADLSGLDQATEVSLGPPLGVSGGRGRVLIGIGLAAALIGMILIVLRIQYRPPPEPETKGDLHKTMGKRQRQVLAALENLDPDLETLSSEIARKVELLVGQSVEIERQIESIETFLAGKRLEPLRRAAEQLRDQLEHETNPDVQSALKLELEANARQLAQLGQLDARRKKLRSELSLAAALLDELETRIVTVQAVRGPVQANEVAALYARIGASLDSLQELTTLTAGALG